MRSEIILLTSIWLTKLAKVFDSNQKQLIVRINNLRVASNNSTPIEARGFIVLNVRIIQCNYQLRIHLIQRRLLELRGM